MFKPILGLKASADPQQLASRLRYKPEVFEFYTSQDDFSKEGLKRLAEAILQVQDQATRRIVLHQPMKYQGEFLEMITPQEILPETYYFLEKSTNDLLELAFDHDCQIILASWVVSVFFLKMGFPPYFSLATPIMTKKFLSGATAWPLTPPML